MTTKARQRLFSFALGPIGLAAYVLIAGKTGFCPACNGVVKTVLGDAAVSSGGESCAVGICSGGLDGDERRGFPRVVRPGSVDLASEFDLTDPRIPLDEVHTLLPKDAIPALTDPAFEAVEDVDWLTDDARVVVVRVGDDAVAAPLAILNWHEVVNMTVGGTPVAATYCPLCDSATVVDRRVTATGGDGSARTETLEFGVSGALYNSNVLMYDLAHGGLWSQLGMEAVTGPMAGVAMDVLPVRLATWDEFRGEHPSGRVVSVRTGHARDYADSPYESFFAHDRLMVPVRSHGDALARKALGLGVWAADGEPGGAGRAWFVPQHQLADGFVLDTPMGEVEARSGAGGVEVVRAPRGVRTAQSFYYAWSAFYPETRVVSRE